MSSDTKSRFSEQKSEQELTQQPAPSTQESVLSQPLKSTKKLTQKPSAKKITKAEILTAGRITTIVSTIVNSLLSLVKLVVGFATGSAVLIADGLHSLTDLATDIFTYIMLKISHNHADEGHPYGHGKFESVGALALAILLTITAIWISVEAVQRLILGTAPELGVIALSAAAFSIVANEFLYFFCRQKGEAVGSDIIIANAWHHRSDSLTSVAALIGIGMNIAGFATADSIAALLVTVILLKTAYDIGRKAFDELVDASIEGKKLEQIKKTLDSIPHIEGYHQLRARKLGSNIFVDVHAEVQPYISVTEGHAISETVEQTLKNEVHNVEDVIVHIDPRGIQETPLPEELFRQDLEHKIGEVIAANCTETVLSYVVIHIFSPQQIELEITIQADSNIPTATLEKTQQALISAMPSYVKISFYCKI